jgi:hypothetical protein
MIDYNEAIDVWTKEQAQGMAWIGVILITAVLLFEGMGITSLGVGPAISERLDSLLRIEHGQISREVLDRTADPEYARLPPGYRIITDGRLFQWKSDSGEFSPIQSESKGLILRDAWDSWSVRNN